MALLDSRNKTQPVMPTSINPGTKIIGDITSDGDIRLDGHLIGNIESKAKVVIGASGVIEGNIMCSSADISGKITGNLHTSDILFLKASGSINGDIEIAKLIVENGASFTGSCKMQSSSEAKNATSLSKVG